MNGVRSSRVPKRPLRSGRKPRGWDLALPPLSAGPKAIHEALQHCCSQVRPPQERSGEPAADLACKGPCSLPRNDYEAPISRQASMEGAEEGAAAHPQGQQSSSAPSVFLLSSDQQEIIGSS